MSLSCGLWGHPTQFQGVENGWKCIGDGWECTGYGQPQIVLYRHRRGGVGLWALFPPNRLGVFVTLQPDVPWLGTPGGYPSLQRQRCCFSIGFIISYQSPPLICATAGTSLIHANRGISLEPNLILHHPGWSLWVFTWMCAPGQASGQLSQGSGGAARWDHRAHFSLQPLPLGRKRSPAQLQALPTSSCSAASMDPPFPASQ